MNLFHKLIKYIFGSEITTIKEQVVVVEVLSKSAYDRLQRKLEPPILSGSDDPGMAQYKLGIQRTLSVVRQDFCN